MCADGPHPWKQNVCHVDIHHTASMAGKVFSHQVDKIICPVEVILPPARYSKACSKNKVVMVLPCGLSNKNFTSKVDYLLLLLGTDQIPQHWSIPWAPYLASFSGGLDDYDFKGQEKEGFVLTKMAMNPRDGFVFSTCSTFNTVCIISCLVESFGHQESSSWCMAPDERNHFTAKEPKQQAQSQGISSLPTCLFFPKQPAW